MQIPRSKPGTMISNAGGGLGASGGMALGVKLALPDRYVVQIVGDGSFYLQSAAFRALPTDVASEKCEPHQTPTLYESGP